ncbi:RTA1 domain-containing protein [Aspergillus homomorphus CBS 101889]|uniref:RTA1 like protein n=1 Tax=Aspergillus homomorphus (strain CBS 101889) TaxID=1450537 RepID=A0A395I0C9_ASPHC|nr:RTA1 like protein [Aspergillus homomorphus CBS 101889]RAL12588.1 RTA1 like protein [Aspergillus homomorphus CBS 101889]
MSENTNIYGFQPSVGAAVVAALLFGGSSLLHCYQTWRHRGRFFLVFIIGAIMMTIGYITRCISAESPSQLGPYIVQYICILLPPSLYAASIYMLYGRIVLLVSQPQLSIIAPTKVTTVFVLGDTLSFLTQLGGGSMMCSASTEETGQKVLIAGLIIQLLSFGLFFVTAIIFEMRLRRLMLFRNRTAWRTLLYFCFVAAALIILRCVYRVIEATQGSRGFLSTHEAYIYCFDALPMFLVQGIFHFCAPGKALRTGGGSAKASYENTDELN